MAFTTGSRCSSLREQMATSAPAFASSIAMDLPMPVPPPVTIAVLPSRRTAMSPWRGRYSKGRSDVERKLVSGWARDGGLRGAADLVADKRGQGPLQGRRDL